MYYVKPKSNKRYCSYIIFKNLQQHLLYVIVSVVTEQ